MLVKLYQIGVLIYLPAVIFSLSCLYPDESLADGKNLFQKGKYSIMIHSSKLATIRSDDLSFKASDTCTILKDKIPVGYWYSSNAYEILRFQDREIILRGELLSWKLNAACSQIGSDKKVLEKAMEQFFGYKYARDIFEGKLCKEGSNLGANFLTKTFDKIIISMASIKCIGAASLFSGTLGSKLIVESRTAQDGKYVKLHEIHTQDWTLEDEDIIICSSKRPQAGATKEICKKLN